MLQSAEDTPYIHYTWVRSNHNKKMEKYSELFFLTYKNQTYILFHANVRVIKFQSDFVF